MPKKKKMTKTAFLEGYPLIYEVTPFSVRKTAKLLNARAVAQLMRKFK